MFVTARRMGCSLWQNHVYGADAPAARNRPHGVHRRGVEVVLSGGSAARGRSDSAGQGAPARGGDVRGNVRCGARAARVQEDSETDNDITLAPEGNKRGHPKSISRYPHFANLHDSSFNIRSHTGTYGYICNIRDIYNICYI